MNAIKIANFGIKIAIPAKCAIMSKTKLSRGDIYETSRPEADYGTISQFSYRDGSPEAAGSIAGNGN
jgi:hypothetical protein